jgi:hypothetical protein
MFGASEVKNKSPQQEMIIWGINGPGRFDLIERIK